MSAKTWLTWLMVGWVISVMLSVLHPAITETNDGWGGVFQVIIIFAAWHILAFLIAAIALILRLVAHTSIQGWQRWASFVPITLSSTFGLFVTIWLLIGE